jgi:hypothetical protein
MATMLIGGLAVKRTNLRLLRRWMSAFRGAPSIPAHPANDILTVAPYWLLHKD